MGDFDGRGVFDGQSLYEMAIGASLANSNAHPTINSFGNVSNDHLALGAENVIVQNADGSTSAATTQTFGDAAVNGKLFKNTALDYLSTYATSTMKQEARAVLTGATVPAGAIDLHTTDFVTGQEQFTYDPTGTNAFSKSDVNRDGVVDFNDGTLVDGFNGKDYSEPFRYAQCHDEGDGERCSRAGGSRANEPDGFEAR